MAKSGFVAIIGRPNSGKSTLLNLILGTRLSIVTPKAQTTRNKILGILTESDGQIVFVDTPGIHKAKEGGINECMVNEAKAAIEAPSLIWYLVDPHSAVEHENAVLDLLQETEAPVFLLMNKIDCVRDGFALQKLGEFEKKLALALKDRKIRYEATLRISSKSGAHVDELLKKTWDKMEEGPQFYPDAEQVSDRPTRFFVAEMIREQLFLLLDEELPYSCAVEIERFDEQSKPPRIEAVIHVERESQKGIVVGRGGQKIREIGMAARKAIEEFLGYAIFLGLKVKLLKDWTRNAEALKRLGFALPPSESKRRRGEKQKWMQ